MTKSLIIVESPAKARTLQKYLGKDFQVKASVGHIRDLPVNELGVDIENDFAPQYVTIRGKGKIIAELKNAAKAADEIFLAPDPDREGEAIAFHIAECLGRSKKPVRRVLFYELTKKAILTSISNASELNHNLFEAQQARRILDRLMGYQISPLLWEKVRRGLSAGRVQSVAVRMICEREEEVLSFKSEEYWSVAVDLNASTPPTFTAQLEKVNGDKCRIGNEQEAQAISAELRRLPYQVVSVEKKKKNRRPSPPFITSTMQMDANRKLRFSAKKTMILAQKLYEGIELGAEGPTGLITYMRTDSTRINNEALDEVRGYIGQTFGQEFLPAKAIVYKAGKSAQDAHEAVRPTSIANTPEKMAGYLDKDMLALYSLIWKRFVACQMAPAVYDQTTVLITAGSYGLKSVGSVMRFLGFMTLYVEASEETAAVEAAEPGETQAGAEGDKTLPDLKNGDDLELLKVLPAQHFTQPPPRYNEATLVKALEENGVGRPSTYAAIISTIQEKEYVLLEQRKFRPTDLGKLVNELLVQHFPAIINVEFTASMEEKLDQVEEGKIAWLKILQKFYGPFSDSLALAKKEMKSVKRSGVVTDIVCSLCGGKMVIKWGRMGEFLACEKFPACKNTQDFKKSEDGAIVPVEREKPAESGEKCEKCGLPLVYKQGRFGRFLACSGYPGCKNIRPETTGVQCPEESCEGEIIKKISKKGKVFYGCSRYPQCSFALWDLPVARKCPDCDSPYLVEKQAKDGKITLKCPAAKCGFSEAVGE